MKSFIYIILIIFSFGCLSQQPAIQKMDEDDYLERVFINGFEVYVNNCTNRDANEFASNYVIRYDKLKNIGYLNYYHIDSMFKCFSLKDSLFVVKLINLVQVKENLNNKVCLFFSMADKNEDFIYCLFIFSNKNFNKFLNQRSKIHRIMNHDSGEINETVVSNFSKYANEYIIAKFDSSLKVFEVKKP